LGLRVFAGKAEYQKIMPIGLSGDLLVFMSIIKSEEELKTGDERSRRRRHAHRADFVKMCVGMDGCPQNSELNLAHSGFFIQCFLWMLIYPWGSYVVPVCRHVNAKGLWRFSEHPVSSC